MPTEPTRDLIEMGGGGPASRRNVIAVLLVIVVGLAIWWISAHVTSSGSPSERSDRPVGMGGARIGPESDELQPLVSLNNIDFIQLPDGRVEIATLVSVPTMTLDRPIVIVAPIPGLADVHAMVTDAAVMDEIGGGTAPTAASLAILRPGGEFAILIFGTPRCGVRLSRDLRLDLKIEYEHAGVTAQVPIVGMAPIEARISNDRCLSR
jgi:hypothetical protein